MAEEKPENEVDEKCPKCNDHGRYTPATAAKGKAFKAVFCDCKKGKALEKQEK